MEILVLIIVFVVGFELGKHYGFFKIVKLMKDVADDLGVDLEKNLKSLNEEDEKSIVSVHKLMIEQHGETLYLFDKETDQFICQGSSVQDLCNDAKKHKNILYAAVMHNDKIFQFKDGISTEVV